MKVKVGTSVVEGTEEETLVEARSDSDVQIDRQIWV